MDDHENYVLSEQSLNPTSLESDRYFRSPESQIENTTSAEGELSEQSSQKRKIDTIDSEENGKLSQSEENQLTSDHDTAEKKIRTHDDPALEPYVTKAETRSLSGAQKRKLLKQRLHERGKKYDPNWRLKNKIKKELDKGVDGKPNCSLGSTPQVQAESSNQPNTERYERGKQELPNDDPPEEYVNDIITSIRMAVFHINYPKRKLNEKDGRKIQFSLIDQFVPLSDGLFPRFTGCYIEKGVLVVACSNKETVLWLEEMVPFIHLSDGPGLIVRERSMILWGTKIKFKAPSHLINQYHDQILDILNKQNKTYSVSEWKTISKRLDPSGKTYICIVDNAALEAIVFGGYKAFLGLDQIRIKVLLK